ncbi:septation ring formation regulator EzrA [Alkalibacterium sp. f15]|uniref:septation ring formation regulator EzrA n=1 Tax=Alkalibacterium sp. f15 TaxID=3414029 RepID=UPI003BF90B38
MSVELIVTLSLVLLAVLIYISTYYMKKKHFERIDELDSQKKELYNKIPTDKVRTLDKMMITGQSKEVANAVITDIDNIEGKNLQTIESHLFEAEQSTDRYRFNQSTKSEKKAVELIKETENSLAITSQNLEELLQREQANLRKIETIKKRYHKVRKELLAKSFTFGDSINSLEEKLGVMENLFTSFSDLTASGDHEEAKKVVSQLETRLTEMEIMMVSIPKLNDKIENNYDKQLEEIEEGHKKLVIQEYNFPESVDMEEKISLLAGKITHLKKLLSKLKLEAIESEQEIVEDLIDELYGTMEKEISAKHATEKLSRKLPKIMYYVTNQSKELSLELDRIGQSYHLYQEEHETYLELNKVVKEQKQLVSDVSAQVGKNDIAYSDAETLLIQAFDRFENLSKSYDSLSESLYSYREKEKEIKNDLEDMEQSLREMKRYIQAKHLPGLPNDYLDIFFYTTDHLEQLSVELARPKLDFKEVTKLHALCDEDIEHLADETEKIVDNALLTELTSQRLYRYKEEYPGVIETIKYSEALFLDEYDYETSLKMVREKLESIEAGAFEEVKAIYNKEKNYA